MSSFTSDLRVAPTNDGKFWIVTRPFSYRIGSKYSNQVIRVRSGTLTDFASIPKIIRLFLPEWAKFNKAPVIHDVLYREQMIMGESISRKQADDVFLEAMLISFESHRIGGFIAYLEYIGVRLFARRAWINYKRKIE
jgi:hypothetical protein